MLTTVSRAVAQYVYRVLYIAGLIIIISTSVYRLTSIKSQQAPKPLVNNKSTTIQKMDSNTTDSFISLVVKPIVESPRNRVIFEGIFWFLVWILVFMLLPVGLLPLKKFKMFNLEFEIGEKEAAAIEKISENSSKALTMVNYSSEESILRFFNEFNDEGEVENEKALKFFLDDLVKGYREEFNTNIQYVIYEEEKTPAKYRNLVNESKAAKTAVILNKLDSDNPLHHNWLVHSMSDLKLVTILTSRLTPFDAMDQYLVTFLHNYVYRIVENRNYALALTEFIEEEEDGQVG